MIEFRISILVACSLLLTACQGSMPRESLPFVLDGNIFGATELVRTSERDSYGKTEVLSGEGSRGEFSVAYISTNSMGVIAETADTPKIVLKGWKALKGKLITYRTSGTIETANGVITYKRFSLDGKSCFNFHKLKQRAAVDDRARYRQLLTGYVCRGGAVEMEEKTIFSFLNSITIPHFSVSVYEKNAQPVTLFEPIWPVRSRKLPEEISPP